MNLLEHKDIKTIKENEKVVMLNPNNSNWIRLNESFYNKNLDYKLDESNDLVKGLIDYRILENNQDNISKKYDLRTVYFAITKRCNLSCEFCSMKSNPNVSTNDDLDIKYIKDTVIPKLKNINPKSIVLTGGEPVIRPDIIELIELINNNLEYTKIILQSNGLLLNENIINELSGKIYQIEISIENIFNNNNIFEKMIKIFDLLKKRNIQMSFSFVVDNKNKKYIKEAMDLVVKYDAAFMMRLVSPAGEALYNSIDYLSDEEVVILYKEITSYIIENGYSETKLVDLVMSSIFPKKSCGAYGNVLSIYPNGEAFMCPNLCEDKFNLGNIVTDKWNDLLLNLNHKLEDLEIKNLLIVDNIKECKDCSVKYFCTGTCLAKRTSTDNVEWFSAGCTLTKLLLKFMIFYHDRNKSNEYNLNMLLDYINESIKKLSLA